MKYYDFLKNIKEISTSHILVNEYGEGDIYEYLNNGEHKYPCIFLTVTNISTTSSTSINFTLFYTDRLLENNSNKTAIQSTGIQVIKQILSKFEQENSIYEFTSVTYTPFTEKFSDMCAGIFAEVVVENPIENLENVECEEGDFETKTITLTKNGVYDIVGYDSAIVLVESDCHEYEELVDELNGTITDLRNKIKVKNDYILDLQDVNAVLQNYFDEERTKNYQLQQRINSVTSLEITENGTYTAPDGTLGYNEITVDITTLPKFKVNSLTVKDNCIENGKWPFDTLIDTSKITTMDSMFDMCEGLKELNTTDWNLSNVTSLKCAFRYCTNLTKIDTSNWNTKKVTNLDAVFLQCYKLEHVDVSKWNTSNVTSIMNLFGMCSKLKSVDVSNWNTSKVTNMEAVFHNANILEHVDVSNWNTSNVTTMQSMFANLNYLKNINVTNWNTSKVKNISYMFYGSVANQLDLSGWNAENITEWKSFSARSSITNYVGGRTIDEVISNNIGILNGLKVGCSTSVMSDNTDRASLRALINGLADLTELTTQSIYLGSTLKAKLTEEDIAIATAKNWTLS